MKTSGHRKVRKYKKIKGSDKFFTLDISLKFDSMDKMKITSSESKEKSEKSGKGLITSLGFKTKAGLQKYKKARYAIRNVSEKYLSRIIKDLEKIERLPYEKKRPKHEPTDSYFHVSRQLEKCMMRSDHHNWYEHSGYTEMTALSFNMHVTDKGGKKIIVHINLSENSSMDVSKSERNIVNKTLSQNKSTDLTE